MPARRISFINFKGGVGKTTLAVNVAVCLANDFGKRVLLVDLDAQSNASVWLMGPERWNEIKEAPRNSAYGIFLPTPPLIGDIIQKSVLHKDGLHYVPDLDLLPATYALMEMDESNGSAPSLTRLDLCYYHFYWALSGFFGAYDYIIFDCPPNVLRASKCAVFTSEELYIPCNLDFLSYVGLSLLVRKVEHFIGKESAHQQSLIDSFAPPQIRGIVLNAVDTRYANGAKGKEMRDKIEDRIRGLRGSPVVAPDADVLTQHIRETVRASAVEDGLPAVLERGELREDYRKLCQHINNTPPKRR
jgi:chromosome partitioning protein